MHRSYVSRSGRLAALLAAAACSRIIDLSGYRFPPLPPDAPVTVVDGRQMTRQELDALLRTHHVLTRHFQRIPPGDGFEEDLAKAVEEAKGIARRQGGNTVLYLEDSELLATIMQDVRYASPGGTITFYTLRTKDG